MNQGCPAGALRALGDARLVADHAGRLGIVASAVRPRPAARHIGAALADTVLQPGVSYRSVVGPRVARIQAMYPSARTLGGLRALVAQGREREFLDWHHHDKPARFSRLVALLVEACVETVDDLRNWLGSAGARTHLLGLHGFGPKSFDYLCCLMGRDHIAVDRHVRSFAAEAGVPARGYDELQLAVSFAADLLGLPRRDFDAWIWTRLAGSSETTQYQLFW